MTYQTDDIEVLEAALAWLQSGQKVALVTVLKTWGSSPRPPGSLLVMNDAGQYAGSVSGGCVEESLLERYCNGELAGLAPTMLDFGVDRQEATRMGLPCGGRLEILIEHINEAGEISSLLALLGQGVLVSREVDLATGNVEQQECNTCKEFELSEKTLVKTYGPAWQLLLIGNGQLARHLASMSLQLDYRIIICDPRDEFTQNNPIADVQYITLMPDDAVKQLKDQTRTAIVTLVHDPRLDDMGLSAALESPAFYIGALGSSRSAQARCERLALLGHSSKQIERIHGPAGMPIGSKRPAEIAVSILAQITAIRNGIK